MSELDVLMDQMIREFQQRPHALAVPQVENEYLMTVVKCGGQAAVVAKNQDFSTWRIYDPNTNDMHRESVETWVGAMDLARAWVRKREYSAAIASFCRDFEPPAVL